MVFLNRDKRDIIKLSQIIQDKQLDYLVDLFLDSLRKRNEWKLLEKKVQQYTEKDWPIHKVNKIYEWERKGFGLYNDSHDKSIEAISVFANKMNEKDFKSLGIWIRESKPSKDTWKKKEITIEDSLLIIKARIAHIVYMMRSSKPVNIGDIINEK